MKSIFILITLLTLAFAFSSCDDDTTQTMEEVCSSALADLGTSAANWASSAANQTEINCNTFKTNLLLVLNNCNTQDYWDLYGGEEGWQDFVDEIEAFDCTMFP